MSRVAPPQIPTSPPQAGGDAVAAAQDELGGLAAAPDLDFADAMQSAAQPEPLEAAEPETAALPALVADSAATRTPPPGESDEGDKDGDAPRRPDPVALSPAMLPSPLLSALLPQQQQQQPAPARPRENAAVDAAPAGLAATPAPTPLAAKALASQLAELAAPREQAAPAAQAAPLPAAPVAEQPSRPAETFSLALPPAQPDSWSGKLQTALGERLPQWVGQNIDRATLRLDPPALGTLEIAIRHQAGALTVELTASHGEVVRQLQGIGEALRQDLGSRQYTQVAVDVREGLPTGHGQGGRQGREQQAQQQPGRALGGQLAGEFELDQG
ncbi:flagellar hook-length control protein FliK [Chromobacterium sp. CV08]|uniref:flagellar hook-length control protein FliK n=1 Tax=Chromobacterium sp. CV08 TaxID=3133274 RepID=UPI003DA80BF0